MLDSTLGSPLDVEELLHLAAHASTRGNPHAALTYLKELLRREPRNARAIYLLGAQHALIGLPERAAAEMTAALEVDPGLEAARFQLGLLLLDRNQAGPAKHHLSLLTGTAEPALRFCAQALIALADNEMQQARDLMAQGLAHAAGNPPLAALMQRFHEGLARQGAPAVTPSVTPGDRMFMGAYRETAER